MLNTFTVSFFGHRMSENALEIENRLDQLIRTLVREHEYVVGTGSLISLFPPPYGVASGNTAATTAHISGYCPISQPSTGTMKNLSGTTTMKSKYAKLLPWATIKMPTKPETGLWWTDRIWLCFASSTQAAAHGRP